MPQSGVAREAAGCGSAEERCGLGRNGATRGLRAAQHRPVVAVAGAVVQRVAMARRCPLRRTARPAGSRSPCRSLRRAARRRRRSPGSAPGGCSTSACSRTRCAARAASLGDHAHVAHFGDDVVRRHLAVRVAGRGDLELGAHAPADGRTGRGERMAVSGIAPSCAETKSIRPKLQRLDAAAAPQIEHARAARRGFRSAVAPAPAGAMPGSRRVASMNATISARVGHVADFRQRDVGQALAWRRAE